VPHKTHAITNRNALGLEGLVSEINDCDKFHDRIVNYPFF